MSAVVKMSIAQRVALAERLRALRGAAGLTMAEVVDIADAAGDPISEAAYRLYENGGVVRMSATRLSALARVYSKSPETLFEELSALCCTPWEYVP